MSPPGSSRFSAAGVREWTFKAVAPTEAVAVLGYWSGGPFGPGSGGLRFAEHTAALNNMEIAEVCLFTNVFFKLRNQLTRSKTLYDCFLLAPGTRHSG